MSDDWTLVHTMYVSSLLFYLQKERIPGGIYHRCYWLVRHKIRLINHYQISYSHLLLQSVCLLYLPTTHKE